MRKKISAACCMILAFLTHTAQASKYSQSDLNARIARMTSVLTSPKTKKKTKSEQTPSISANYTTTELNTRADNMKTLLKRQKDFIFREAEIIGGAPQTSDEITSNLLKNLGSLRSNTALSKVQEAIKECETNGEDASLLLALADAITYAGECGDISDVFAQGHSGNLFSNTYYAQLVYTSQLLNSTTCTKFCKILTNLTAGCTSTAIANDLNNTINSANSSDFIDCLDDFATGTACSPIVKYLLKMIQTSNTPNLVAALVNFLQGCPYYAKAVALNNAINTNSSKTFVDNLNTFAAGCSASTIISGLRNLINSNTPAILADNLVNFLVGCGNSHTIATRIKNVINAANTKTLAATLVTLLTGCPNASVATNLNAVVNSNDATNLCRSLVACLTYCQSQNLVTYLDTMVNSDETLDFSNALVNFAQNSLCYPIAIYIQNMLITEKATEVSKNLVSISDGTPASNSAKFIGRIVDGCYSFSLFESGKMEGISNSEDVAYALACIECNRSNATVNGNNANDIVANIYGNLSTSKKNSLGNYSELNPTTCYERINSLNATTLNTYMTAAQICAMKIKEYSGSSPFEVDNYNTCIKEALKRANMYVR